MRKFHYRPGRNAFAAMGMGVLALLCAWSWLAAGSVFAVGGLVVFGAAAVKAALNAMSDEPALSLGSQTLKVRTSFGTKEVSWPEVQGIGVEVFTYRYWGIIPIARHENLVIKCNGGAFGAKRLRIAVASIDLPPGGATTLLAILHQYHVAAVGKAGVAVAGAGEQGWGVRRPQSARVAVDDDGPVTGFDPDAALARYMASRGEAAPVPASVASTGICAPSRPAQPVRAGFGRRGL